VRVEQVNERNIVLLAFAQPAAGVVDDPVPLLLDRLLRQCIAWLEQVRDEAGYVGLRWTEHYMMQDAQPEHALEPDGSPSRRSAAKVSALLCPPSLVPDLLATSSRSIGETDSTA
jgi:hypothetical protein